MPHVSGIQTVSALVCEMRLEHCRIWFTDNNEPRLHAVGGVSDGVVVIPSGCRAIGGVCHMHYSSVVMAWQAWQNGVVVVVVVVVVMVGMAEWCGGGSDGGHVMTGITHTMHGPKQ